MSIPSSAERRARVAALLSLLSLAGCGLAVHGSVAPSAARPWQPRTDAASLPPATDAARTVRTPAPEGTPTLRDLLVIGLENDPQSRAAFLRAREALDLLHEAKGAYLPTIQGQASASTQHQTLGSGFAYSYRSYGVSGSLTWLLLDLGGREASIDEAHFALIAADETHDAALYDAMLRIEQAWYQDLAAAALVKAAQASVDAARRDLDAAQGRAQAGLATKADVLEAKTALSQALLDQAQAQGQEAIARGTLATAVGLAPGTLGPLAELPSDLPVKPVTESVEQYLARAAAHRPELLRARALAAQAARHVATVRAQALPRIEASANAGRQWFLGGSGGHGDSYGATVSLQVPIFAGLRDQQELARTKREARAAAEDVRTAEQQVALEVWTSYETLRTAADRVAAARDLLASASESADVAAGRYQSGVGSILDLLTAESALASARAQEVQARADWLAAVAALAHDSGAMGLVPESEFPAVPGEESNP